MSHEHWVHGTGKVIKTTDFLFRRTLSTPINIMCSTQVIGYSIVYRLDNNSSQN